MAEDDIEKIEELFVHLGSGVTCTPATLTIEGVALSRLAFSDRLERVVGHVTTRQFVDDCTPGPDSFESDQPNAVPNFPEADGAPGDSLVERRARRLTAHDRVLERAVASVAGACSLVIDPFGRPRSRLRLRGASPGATPDDVNAMANDERADNAVGPERTYTANGPELADPGVRKAIADAVVRLQARHPTAPGPLVQTCVADAYRHLCRAPVRDFLAILVERNAGWAMAEALGSRDPDR
jgi:hypothetical protein